MATNIPRSFFLEISPEDYCELPQDIQNLFNEAQFLYYCQRNFIGTIKRCDLLLQNAQLNEHGLLILKLMFLISKCHLEMDEFIAAKYFLDKTYQLILSICPERIHELDPFLIEIEERQGNIVGAIVLSILFKKLNCTETVQKLNDLKAKLECSMSEEDIINRVFHPLFETAKVYLNDGEPSLAVAIFDELMQILSTLHCNESFKSRLMNRVRLNRKVAKSKSSHFQNNATHYTSPSTSEASWEGLPPPPAPDINDDPDDFEAQSNICVAQGSFVRGAHFLDQWMSGNTHTHDNKSSDEGGLFKERGSKSEQAQSLPKTVHGNSVRDARNVYENEVQGNTIKKPGTSHFATSHSKVKTDHCDIQRQSLPLSANEIQNSANNQTRSYFSILSVNEKKDEKSSPSSENERNDASRSDIFHSGTSPVNVQPAFYPELGSQSIHSSNVVKTHVLKPSIRRESQSGQDSRTTRIEGIGSSKTQPMMHASSLKSMSLEINGTSQRPCNIEAAIKTSRDGERGTRSTECDGLLEIQPDLLSQNKFIALSAEKSPREEEEEDNSESFEDDHYSELSTQNESMSESNAESMSETSEVPSTNETPFCTVTRKKRTKRKVSLPDGVDVICEHFQAKPSNPRKVCKGCESRCFFAFISQVSNRWEKVRPYPNHLNKVIELHNCFGYMQGKPCNRDCTHPHGPAEMEVWNLERQGGLPSPERCLRDLDTREASSKTRKKRSRKKRRDEKTAEAPPQQLLPASVVSRGASQKTLNQPQPSSQQKPPQAPNICYLPKGVSLVCRHFMAHYGQVPIGVPQRRNVCKRCNASQACNDVRYAFWSAKFSRWFLIRSRPTNVQPNTAFQNCKQFIRGVKCGKDPCTFGHGPETMVWTMEREGVLVPPPKAFYCVIMDESLEGRSMMRPLPPTVGNVKLCQSVQSKTTCRYGRCCRNAHSKEELIHWQELYKEKVNSRQQEAHLHQQQQQQPRRSTQDVDVRGPRHDLNEDMHMNKEHEQLKKRTQTMKKTDNLPGVIIWSVPKNPNITLTETGDTHQHQWTFCIRYKMENELGAPNVILGERHSGYFSIKSVSIDEVMSKQPRTKRLKDRTLHFIPPKLDCLKGRDVEMKVVVEFRSGVFGSFAQSLLFDFGKDPCLIKEFNIDVLLQGMDETLQQLTSVREELSQVTDENKIDENKIVRMVENEEESKLFARYRLPKDVERIVSAQMVDKHGTITPDHYVQVMHQLLYAEEAHMRSLLSRLIPSDAKIKVTKSYLDESRGLTTAVNGGFFGTIELQAKITPDDMPGRICTRKVNSVLIQPRVGHSNLYEAPIEVLKDDRVIVRLFPRLCQDLKIKQESQELDVNMWFNLNRTILCRMHRALDSLTETHKRLLFPVRQTIIRQKENVPPWLIDLDGRLNEYQLQVIKSITEIQSPSAPLVIFGPFGTGKTLTLNQAILHLVTKQSNRILVCTHTNSAADIHVELLDEHIKNYKMASAKPLRLYDPDRKVATVSQVTRKYCLIDNDAFMLPTRQDINRHKVVITTLITADLLTKLDVRHGFFTHILIDEAAQAWETEAIIPISFAGPNTKIVFTGDHQQMSPEVYTTFGSQYSLRTSLPERLFHHYKQETDTVFQDSHLILLNVNYRSNSEILKFPSDNFYGGTIVAMGDEGSPPHPDFGALRFFTSRGRDLKQHDNTYLNAAEVSEVVKRVDELVQSWPECWGTKNLKEVAVLAPYRYQVQAIRGELRKKGLGKVTVDTIHNVQGMEFRALFISTVRTRESVKDLKESPKNLSLEFLSDPKLLVTAITRAKSFVAVVGDPVSLCSLGECQWLWLDFIQRCSNLGAFHGMELNDLSREIDACTAIPNNLNPDATPFVPRNTSVTETSSQEPSIGEEKEQESEGSCDRSSTCSDADDEFEEENPFEELKLKVYDPPRHFDKIVEAFIKKAKVSKDEEQVLDDQYVLDEPAEPSETENKPKYRGLKSSDYEIKRINGREEIRLIALYPQMPVRSQHTNDYTDNLNQDHLSPEVLKQMIDREPQRYLVGQLRVSFESKTSYIEFPDKNMPDIKITGDVRQAFDQDTVVLDITKVHPDVKDALENENLDRNVGMNKSSKCDCVLGILNNLINPRERQYVCKLEKNNIMVPINKSVPKIVNLSDKSSSKIPVYKHIANTKKRPEVQRMVDPRYAKQQKYLFLVKFLQWRRDCYRPLGIVLNTISQGEDVTDSARIVDAEHGVRRARGNEVTKEAEEHFHEKWKIPRQERLTRERVENAFTIDPEESKDLDDAVSVELEKGFYKIGVHIADVSYFVKPGSKIDEDARKRGTTYYPGIPDFENVTMLPRSLSENHCSLLAKKDRLTQTVYVIVDRDGNILEYPTETKSTITRSRCRLTYSEAQKIIERQAPDKEISEKDLKLLTDSIPLLHSLAQNIRRRRLGAVRHDDGKVDAAAHELIEEMMILANCTVGRILSTNREIRYRTPYVSQLGPKVHRLNKWATDYGKYAKYHPVTKRQLECDDIQTDVREMLFSEGSEERNITIFKSCWDEMLECVKNGDYTMLPFLIGRPGCSPQLQMANQSFRRIQCRSEYKCAKDDGDITHHDLAVSNYVHFTSPIRRYVDIEIHRRLKSEEVENDIEEIETFCRRSTFIKHNAKKFQKECKRIHFAHSLKNHKKGMEVIVDEVDRHSFVVHAVDTEQDLFSRSNNRISYQELSVFDEPMEPDAVSGTTLTWRVRFYISPSEEEGSSDRKINRPQYREKRLMKNLLLSVAPDDTSVQLGYQVKGTKWLRLIEASQKKENSTEIHDLVEDIREDLQDLQMRRGDAKHVATSPYVVQMVDVEPFDEEGHYYTVTMSLKPFDIIQVQLFSRLSLSVLIPDIQLFKISSNFDICVEHRRLPRHCFAKLPKNSASEGAIYDSIERYIRFWKPVLAMEIATQAVSQNEGFILKSHLIKWSKRDDGEIEGEFSLKESYCMARQLDFKFGDLACVRIQKVQDEPALVDVTSGQNTKTAASVVSTKRARSIWVGHCVIRKVPDPKVKSPVRNVTLNVVNASFEMPEQFLDGRGHVCDLEVIQVPVPLRRMSMALASKLKESTELVQTICCGWNVRETNFKIPQEDLSLASHYKQSGFHPLNHIQKEVVQSALKKSFSLIQGPPGTGKTFTGVHIAYWFTKQNLKLENENDTSTEDKEAPEDKTDKKPSQAPPQVLYCGPSNKSVDVVTEYLLRIPGMKEKILRVYGSMIAETEYPIPNKVNQLKPHVSDDELRIPEGELKEVSLHHMIRRPPCPYESDIRQMEVEFKKKKERKERPSDEEVKEYCKLISTAEEWVVEKMGKQIILCTCSRSGSNLIIEKANIKQCIVDESGMCMEPEVLVPLTSSKAQQIVLIGDHKQLQPIVADREACRLGLAKSMFERLHKEAKMLRIQYRMHKAICKFPSIHFYDDQLITDKTVEARPPSIVDFWPAPRNGPIVFCNVEGEEKSSVVSTAESGAESKYNEKEANKVVQVAKYLVNKHGIKKTDIVVLTPYREQRKHIAHQLKGAYDEIKVTTIIKSQGSEWDYVIISLVRSLPHTDIDPTPSSSWLSEHLGFIRDEHQINVALTRAKYGLCIIGNKNLMSLDKTWYPLLQHYEKQDCIVNDYQWPETSQDDERYQWPEKTAIDDDSRSL